ncbi:MAG: peptide chain release factor N(5)-glutamine methyltransferase [Aquamicrobium sp.]|uniref:peptide chain release factor N(5)-glutamine methyltransferase n=1 Tax=Aquamicrobium sp. TaxID=1872579 RepID=UPI00349E8222|nr:peptide chain release factor N(5)-glutamine methyltransferase [Aquamicrobium sp.]
MAEGALPATLGALLRHVRRALEEAGVTDAGLDARLIVEHAAGASRTDLVTDSGRPIGHAQVEAARTMLARRLAGEPVHRILGSREFYGLRLALSAGTLEPRPDTEALVEAALPFARRAADRHGACRILDLGTGTGAVALALLAQEPRAQAVASDISPDALATAAANADMTGVAPRFTAVRSDWFGGIEGRFHLIVSNPPYIASSEIAMLAKEVREHDPRAALDGGADGLDAYRAIAAGAPAHLETDGVVAVEIGIGQEADVEALFATQGFGLASTARDLGDVLRALVFAR